MNDDPILLLGELLIWAQEANSRLAYERTPVFQFGGNPYLNPLFKRVKACLAAQPDDRETLAEGDYPR